MRHGARNGVVMSSFKATFTDQPDPRAGQSDERTYASNALRFEESWEAEWYARDLFSRWMGARAWRIEESDDQVTCHVATSEYDPPSQWVDRKLVHEPRDGASIDARARAVCRALNVAGEALDRMREREADEAEPAFVVPWSREVEVSALPSHVRDALARVGYVASTVSVEVALRKLVVSSCANDGQRAIVATATAIKDPGDRGYYNCRVFVEEGPYGGPNPFTRCTLDDNPVRAIPVGGCIVTARTAHKRKSPYATVHALAIDALSWLSPDAPELAVARDLLQLGKVTAAHTLAREGLESIGKPSIDPLESCILTIYRGIKGGHRAKYIERAGDPERVKLALDALVARGLLKRSKSGATSLSPEGRNAIEHVTSNGSMRTPEGAYL